MGKEKAPLYKIKNLIETDMIDTANSLLDNGWILVNTYKKWHGRLFYVLGKIPYQ